MNVIEKLRKNIIQDLFLDDNNKALWKSVYSELLGENPTSADILGLGSHLKDLFKSTNQGDGRSQSAVSKAGNIWESLITWYFNLCCAGSRVLAFKGSKNIPEIIKTSVSVTYGTLPCASEPDITVLVFPNRPIYTEEGHLSDFINKRENIDKSKLNNKLTEDFSLLEIGVIQCKTNWNENAQIPMLWDIIYKTPIGRLQGIKVGTPPYSINYIPFTYSFVTVPTNKNDLFKPTSVCVARVKNISGGNYWGITSEPGVALSFDYIFQANFSNGFIEGNINKSLNLAIKEMKEGGEYYYFFS